MILHDLLMCGGADPPLQVDGVRPAVVLDAGAGMGAVVQWLRDTQKVILSALQCTACSGMPGQA
eukprot:1556858-Rhodomonas_salina.1